MEKPNNILTINKFTPGFIAILCTCIIFYLINTYGISLTPDSSYYISVARHLANGDGFIGYNNEPFVLQAPLYPLIFALIKTMFGVDPLVSAGIVNSIIFGLIIYLSGSILLKHISSFFIALMGILVVACSFVLIKFFLFALTEPLFILFILLYIYYINKYLTTGKKSTLIIFSIFAALACLTRYVGIVLILSGIITIISWKNNSAKNRIRELIVFLLISSLPISLWIVRNYFISHTFLGQRYASSFTFSENLIFFSNTILHWFVNFKLDSKDLIPVILILTTLAYITINKLFKKDGNAFNSSMVNQLLLFIFLYSGAVIISSTTTAYDHIADRLLLPIYIPIVLLVFFFLNNVPGLFEKYYYKILGSTFAVLVIVIWLSYIITNTTSLLKDYVRESGWEFGSKEWKNSQTINLLDNLTINKKYELYSNAPDVVYILSDKEAQWSPGKTYYNSPTPVNNTGLPMWKGKGKAYLVWFNNIDREFLYSVDALEKHTGMIKIVQAKDGEIYLIDIR
jgi:hypothetical protein